MKIYYIGGSTCCGKSTIAELLAQRHDLSCFKLDDYLDSYLEQMAGQGDPLAAKILGYSMNEMWMREPELLCREEMDFYRNAYPYVERQLAAYSQDASVVAEGAGFLPALMRAAGVSADCFLCMAPTREFQLAKYAQRPWIGQYLDGCPDPEQAFKNWMERDALFALSICRDAQEHGYSVIVVDGGAGIEENYTRVERLFGLA